MQYFRVGLVSLALTIILGLFFVVPAAVQAEESIRLYAATFPGALVMLQAVVVVYFTAGVSASAALCTRGIAAMKAEHGRLTDLQQAVLCRDTAVVPVVLGLAFSLLGHSVAGPLFMLLGFVTFVMAQLWLRRERRKLG